MFHVNLGIKAIAKAQKMRESINIASTTAASNFYFLSQFLIFTFYFSYTRRCVYNNSRGKNTHDFQFSFVLISIFFLLSLTLVFFFFIFYQVRPNIAHFFYLLFVIVNAAKIIFNFQGKVTFLKIFILKFLRVFFMIKNSRDENFKISFKKSVHPFFICFLV